MNKFTVLILVLLGLGVICLIIKNTIWFHVRNWFIDNKLQPPVFNEYTKHYVRVIKRYPTPTELIKEIKNDELHIPVNDKGALVSTEFIEKIKNQNWRDIVFASEIEKDENGEFCLILRHRHGNTPVPIRLRLNMPHNLEDEQIQLIYTNIKAYGKN